MKDYLKPLIRRKPDEIILHIGTNNLKDSSPTPQQLAEGISNLGTQIRNSSPSTKICLSKIRGFGMATKFVYYLLYTKNVDVLGINNETRLDCIISDDLVSVPTVIMT